MDYETPRLEWGVGLGGFQPALSKRLRRLGRSNNWLAKRVRSPRRKPIRRRFSTSSSLLISDRTNSSSSMARICSQISLGRMNNLTDLARREGQARFRENAGNDFFRAVVILSM